MIDKNLRQYYSRGHLVKPGPGRPGYNGGDPVGGYGPGGSWNGGNHGGGADVMPVITKPPSGPPGGGDPGMTYTKPPVRTGDGPPSVLNPQPFNYGNFRKNAAKKSLWNKFLKHRTATQLMKRMVEGPKIPGTDEYAAPTYTHALGGYDWKQNFPDSPDWVDKGLAYGYQHLTEATRALTDPTSYGTGIFGLAKNLGSAFNKANVEAAKNIQGFTGEGISPEAMQKYQTWQNLFARGGRASYFDGGLLSLWPR